MTDKNKITPELLEAIKVLCAENNEVKLVSLCTTDGFTIKFFAKKELIDEADKIAAMSSTISALSNSSVKEILQDQFEITTIETMSGNVMFVSTDYLKQPCVLTIATNSKMALATARYKTKQLAQVISNISN